MALAPSRVFEILDVAEHRSGSHIVSIQQGHRCFVNIAPIVLIDAACKAFLFHPVQMQEIIVVLCLHNRVINDRIRNINPADQLRTACLMLFYGCHINMHRIVHGYGGGGRGCGCGGHSRCGGCSGRGRRRGFRNNRKLCRRFYFYCRLTGIEKERLQPSSMSTRQRKMAAIFFSHHFASS